MIGHSKTWSGCALSLGKPNVDGHVFVTALIKRDSGWIRNYTLQAFSVVSIPESAQKSKKVIPNPQLRDLSFPLVLFSRDRKLSMVSVKTMQNEMKRS